tara:strand:- start:554 stop:1099 length:546 start_codon:yes stop_codon:yes gene_type:complete
MQKITINLSLIFCLLVSCSTIKNDKIGKIKTEDNLVTEYCKAQSDKNFFRANATIKHPDLGESEYEAVQFAKAQMAENISQKIKTVTDRYKKTRTINGVVEFDKSVEGITRYSSEVDLADVKVICTKVIRIKEEGVYQRFVAVEMSKTAVIEDLENKISKDDAMYQDYRRSEMRKVLDAEL